MLRLYDRALSARPILTKVATSSLLYTLGDCLSQKLDGSLEKSGYDPLRTLRMTLYGGVLFAPYSHLWYVKILGRVFKNPAAKNVHWKKLLCDQTFFGPSVNALFLTWSVVSNQGSLEDVKSTMQERYLGLVKANLSVWPAAMYFNFKFIPVKYQVLYVNCVVFAWSTFLSVQATKTASGLDTVVQSESSLEGVVQSEETENEHPPT